MKSKNLIFSKIMTLIISSFFTSYFSTQTLLAQKLRAVHTFNPYQPNEALTNIFKSNDDDLLRDKLKSIQTEGPEALRDFFLQFYVDTEQLASDGNWDYYHHTLLGHCLDFNKMTKFKILLDAAQHLEWQDFQRILCQDVEQNRHVTILGYAEYLEHAWHEDCIEAVKLIFDAILNKGRVSELIQQIQDPHLLERRTTLRIRLSAYETAQARVVINDLLERRVNHYSSLLTPPDLSHQNGTRLIERVQAARSEIEIIEAIKNS